METDAFDVSSVEGGEESAAGEEDGAKQMTLDEYKAEQKKLRMKADFKLRKASEGEDSHKWAKAVPFQRNDDFVSDRAKLVTVYSGRDRRTDRQTDRQTDMNVSRLVIICTFRARMMLTLTRDTSQGESKRLSLISELGSTILHPVVGVGVAEAKMTFAGVVADEDAVATLDVGKIRTGTRPLLPQILRIRMTSLPLVATETWDCWCSRTEKLTVGRVEWFFIL